MTVYDDFWTKYCTSNGAGLVFRAIVDSVFIGDPSSNFLETDRRCLWRLLGCKVFINGNFRIIFKIEMKQNFITSYSEPILKPMVFVSFVYANQEYQ